MLGVKRLKDMTNVGLRIKECFSFIKKFLYHMILLDPSAITSLTIMSVITCKNDYC